MRRALAPVAQREHQQQRAQHDLPPGDAVRSGAARGSAALNRDEIDDRAHDGKRQHPSEQEQRSVHPGAPREQHQRHSDDRHGADRHANREGQNLADPLAHHFTRLPTSGIPICRPSPCMLVASDDGAHPRDRVTPILATGSPVRRLIRIFHRRLTCRLFITCSAGPSRRPGSTVPHPDGMRDLSTAIWGLRFAPGEFIRVPARPVNSLRGKPDRKTRGGRLLSWPALSCGRRSPRQLTSSSMCSPIIGAKRT